MTVVWGSHPCTFANCERATLMLMPWPEYGMTHPRYTHPDFDDKWNFGQRIQKNWVTQTCSSSSNSSLMTKSTFLSMDRQIDTQMMGGQMDVSLWLSCGPQLLLLLKKHVHPNSQGGRGGGRFCLRHNLPFYCYQNGRAEFIRFFNFSWDGPMVLDLIFFIKIWIFSIFHPWNCPKNAVSLAQVHILGNH